MDLFLTRLRFLCSTDSALRALFRQLRERRGAVLGNHRGKMGVNRDSARVLRYTYRGVCRNFYCRVLTLRCSHPSSPPAVVCLNALLNNTGIGGPPVHTRCVQSIWREEVLTSTQRPQGLQTLRLDLAGGELHHEQSGVRSVRLGAREEGSIIPKSDASVYPECKPD